MQLYESDMDEDHVSPYFRIEGDIDLRADVLQNQLLRLLAALDFPDGQTETFETYVTAGNPELTLQSTIVSNDFVQDGVKLTSTVRGRMPLGFESSTKAFGVGQLEYQEFTVEGAPDGCSITTSTHDGSSRAISITFPDSTSL